MEEFTVWEIVAATGGQSDGPAMTAFRQRLSAEAPAAVEEFGRMLVDKVYALDTVAHYQQADACPDEELEDLDPDLFVSVRCAVVLAGPSVYAQVLEDPPSIAARRWPGAADAERLIESTDRVFAEQSVGTGSLPGTGQVETGSNPEGFRDAVAVPAPPAQPAQPAQQVVQVERAEGAQEWAGVSFDVDDPAFMRTWKVKGIWPQFDLTVRKALNRAANSPGRHEALVAAGVDQVEFEITLARSSSTEATRVRRDRSGSLAWIEVTTHLPLNDASALEELERWAHDAFDEAFAVAQTKLTSRSR